MTPPFFFFRRKRREPDPATDKPTGVTTPASDSGQSTFGAVAHSEGEASPPPPPPPPPADPEPPAPSPELDKALAAWREELAALGGVASLDDITILDGVVDLTAAHPSGLAQLYAGRPTHLANLVRERSAQSVARRSLRDVAGRTQVIARQFGVAPVYLALGVATWNETLSRQDPTASRLTAGSGALANQGGEAGRPEEAPEAGGTAGESPTPADAAGPRGAGARTVNAPVLLRPVRLSTAMADTTIALDPSIEVNPVLTRALRRYGCTADVDALARASLSAEGFTPRATLARIGALGREYLPGFDIHERLVVGAFAHPGQALVEDFDAIEERARSSALVAALAGDQRARAALDVPLDPPRREDRDPDAERGAGDLDPAQLDAVEAVGTGASLLLDAPPGSDIAATLAAILADAAASGRTVMHVPSTSADGRAVADALRELGLGSIVMDLTEDAAWRRNAAEGIKESLGVREPDLDVAEIVALRQELVSVRSRLSRYITALHAPRAPWQVSAHEALKELAGLTSSRARPRTTARVEAGHLARLDPAGLSRARELLHTAHALGALSPEVSASPWRGIPVADIDEAVDTLHRLQNLADTLCPQIDEDITRVVDETRLTRALTLGQWCEQLDMLDGVRESLDIFRPEIFERSAADMVIATASKRWREERHLDMNGSTRRRFTRQAKDLVRPGRVVDDLHAELVKVQQRREVWRRHDSDGGWPRLPGGLDTIRRTADLARTTLEQLQPVVGNSQGIVLMDMPLEDLLTRARVLADDDAVAQNLPRINQVLGELDALGLTPLVKDLAARRLRDDQIDTELTYCWWSSLLSQALRNDPDMGGLDATALAGLAASLRELDAAHTASLAGPVAQACARRVREAIEADKDTARSLYLALSREDGIPLRDILAAYPLAMIAKPVWIVPPTLVSQVFVPTALIDLAVLDASAHLPVAQALPAFVRAEQVLVVGDPRRATSGLAGELGPLLPRVTLPTGRNTLDAEIAAFLAANGYEGVVEAIPAPPGANRLNLDLVEGRGMPAPGQTAVESVGAEVEHVVDLVIEHALRHPEQSLGVIALNLRHAEALRQAVATAVAGSESLERFFAPGAPEPFTVVDLSEARSLRRDHVILSVGYAKTPHGRTIYSFGDVSDHGGMVALVEALCASRGTTRVVSCLEASDIDPDRLHSAGPRLLREVLVRAGAQPPTQTPEPGGEPDGLLIDLAEHLWRRGLTVVPRYGMGDGPKIPLAIGHPDCPGELFVAVLTDDADYVAEPSLRRRDRHWVERLTQRGWRVHMAYSAGVFVDPEAQARTIEDEIIEVLEARAQAQAGPEVEAVPEHVDDLAPGPRLALVPDPPSPLEPEPQEGAAPGGAAHEGSAPGLREATRTGSKAGEAERGPRPPIAQGLPLQAYSDDQLDDLMAWIRSDGIERTVEEEAEELRATLALRRRGSGIDAVLANVVGRTR